MRYNKRSYVCGQILIATLAILLVSVATPYAAEQLVIPRWPQKINPEDTNRQTLNPEYIQRQEAVQQAELQLHRQRRLTRQFSKWTRTRFYPKRRNNYRTKQKLMNLKNELHQTPRYITEASPSTKPAQE